METLRTDSEHDYDDTSETTLSLYALAPTETYVDSEDLESFEELSYSDMEANSWAGYDYDYAYPRQYLTDRTAECRDLHQSSGSDSLDESKEYNDAVPSEITDEEKALKTASSCIDLDTALSESSIYSEYTPAPSETNVEIEYDIIAEASPMSTAVSGNVSWYSLPKTDAEIEVQAPLYIGGARVVDSIECLNMLSEAKLIPVEDLGNPTINYLGSCPMKTPSEIEEEKYEYSYYSDATLTNRTTKLHHKFLTLIRCVLKHEIRF
ncbi:hypothetical protein RB195_013421 [Necator americanus]|uniref:Uncharacterized protein n=1 Tax=Necator americanus TaxID=51031 RepID=A0ABR1DVF5_NECAM